MKRYLTYLFIAAAMLSAVACERAEESVMPMPEPDYSAPITIGSVQVNDNYIGRADGSRAEATDGASTRGETASGSGVTISGMAFGLYGSYTGAADFVPGTTQAANYLTNHKFVYNATAGCWTGEPAAYWPIRHDEKMSFFAYAPYDANGTQVKLNSQAGTIRLLVTPATVSADQIDLCIADARTTDNITFSSISGGVLPLSFEHVMARINPTFCYTKGSANAGSSDTYTIKVKSMTISGLRGAGVMRYALAAGDAASYFWESQGNYPVATYNCTVNSSTKVPMTTATAAIASPLFVVPQGVAADQVKITLTYNIRNNSDTDTTGLDITESLTVSSAMTFVKGQVYNMNFTIMAGTGVYIESISEKGSLVWG